jgi:hypothetical protein
VIDELRFVTHPPPLSLSIPKSFWTGSLKKNTFGSGCCSLHRTTPPNSFEGFSISTTTGRTTGTDFLEQYIAVNDCACFSDILPMISS